jgi:hypothetical protein
MNVHDASDRVIRRLIALDQTQLSMGCMPISHQDLTDLERADEITWRLTNAATHEGDSGPLLEVAGAHLLAWLVAEDEKQMARPESGSEAA